MELTLNHWVIVLACLSACFTKVFFWLLELQNPRLEARGLLAYQSASQFMRASASGQGLFRYLIFRISPNIISGIATIGFASNFDLLSRQDLVWTAAIATVVANSKTLHCVLDKKCGSSVRLLNFVVFILVLLSNALILFVHQKTSIFEEIFPDMTSLKDNLWASLIAALLIAIYLRALSMSREDSVNDQSVPEAHGIDTLKEDTATRSTKKFAPLKAASANRTVEKLRTLLVESSKAHRLPPELMAAIIYFEALNRPRHFRIVEDLLVRIPGISLTVGPAQIRSNRPLSDQESVSTLACRMARARDQAIAEGLTGENVIKAILRNHNRSDCFVDSVLEIYWNSIIQ